MKRSAFDESRDRRVADDGGYPRGFDPEFMCRADGCPNRWSVRRDSGTTLCSAHDATWYQPKAWPEITQRLQWDETERAQRRAAAADRAPPFPLSHEDKSEILAKLHEVPFGLDAARSLKWAAALREREVAGDRLTFDVRAWWRQVLHVPDGQFYPQHEEVMP